MFVLTLASDQHPGLSSHSLCLSRKYVQTHLSSLTDEPGAPGLSAGSEHPGEAEGSRAPRITCPTCQPAPLFTPGERLGCCGLGSPKGTGSRVGSGSREGPSSWRASPPAPLEEKWSEEQKSPEKQAGFARDLALPTQSGGPRALPRLLASSVFHEAISEDEPCGPPEKEWGPLGCSVSPFC